MAPGAKTRSPQRTRSPRHRPPLAAVRRLGDLEPERLDDAAGAEVEPPDAPEPDAPEAGLDDEPDGETGEEEAAVEAEVAAEEEETAADEARENDAVVEVLLRRTGVLPADVELEDRDDDALLPPPRGRDEFVCTACFLIKARTQLGDEEHGLCRECAEDLLGPARARRSRRIA